MPFWGSGTYSLVEISRCIAVHNKVTTFAGYPLPSADVPAIEINAADALEAFSKSVGILTRESSAFLQFTTARIPPWLLPTDLDSRSDP